MQSIRVSQEASDSCDAKVKALQSFSNSDNPGKQTTQFSENEINSYLALELSSEYHPSLKSLVMSFEESTVQGVITIDFDQLSLGSTNLVAKLLTKLLSGIHNLRVRGKLLADHGEAQFQLEEARFDTVTLPNFLVEEIITAVGRKQKPPFDPLQPNQMPYRIEKVDVHAGYIVVYQ